MSLGQEHISQYIQREEARKHQRRADLATGTRLYGAVPTSIYMAFTKRKWGSTIVNAGLWATDTYDGFEAKKAREILPGLARTKMSRKDPKADKEMQYGNAGAIFIRALAEGDKNTMVAIGITTAVSAYRDRKMAETRALANTHMVDTDAIGINRVKTLATAVSETTLLSPIADNKTARQVMLGTLCMATVVGLIGERMFNQQVVEKIAEQQAVAPMAA